MSEILFSGQSLTLARIADGFAELRLARTDASINKLDRRTLSELDAAATILEHADDVRGLLVTSGLDVFVVGADITEFGEMFERSQDDIVQHNWQANQLFERLAALPMPSVVAINGFALGGGLELALAFDYRVMAEEARVGLPEVGLGLIPGFGGTVRLPRVSNVEVALAWIVSGKPQSAAAALAAGVVEQTLSAQALCAGALELLREAVSGRLDWRAARQARLGKVAVVVSPELFDKSRETLRSDVHQPARAVAIDLLEQAWQVDHPQALRLEGQAFARLAKTQAAASLVRNFLNDQWVKKTCRIQRSGQSVIAQAVVLGAGIMGGGIAYTSALHGTAVRMKDIRQQALDLGVAEAEKLLARQISNGRLSEERAGQVRAAIQPQLDYQGFADADVVIEAVVENLAIKHSVLCEVEREVAPDAVLLSNTSSLRIDDLATPLQRPECFAGMHFFNPVPVMPLVEIIRGKHTGDRAVAIAVSMALSMGKTPIVVRDGPGFLVNRILAAYIRAFLQLISDGADFEQIDRAAEAFGWPMGPAYLEDVVGLDTGSHVCDLIFAGFPSRMTSVPGNAFKTLLADGRLGQKNGLGFYRYEPGPGGRPRKFSDERARQQIAAARPGLARHFEDDEVTERLMLALIIESIHALQEGVVASAAELDTALLLGLGFPAYLGGALVYADWLGAEHLLARCAHYVALGPAYEAPDLLRELAASGGCFYPR
ncbi:fatty acid oxidation complex subunit alpha FadB [Pseudomonas sp. NFACC13-1]|uniref:fatty acid oxidation complex subunit alpha FadB n=1 Tax=Pseudomonas sp. NFACC13-1 TaxID=1566245 RepID=UPI00089268E0|nr:fatty acid oxidation complex subunit alpha FadB [Pseudomonas sp. NFACC13-1]SDB35001.1 3-hydroxyacyl-CoA dehydrogenase / enoyl-CoA hydratase / 3-hydroxybutyryl-CoA epimerase / enoyl-CoA isomerase [Pseudomonas sp. NFACC13-1]